MGVGAETVQHVSIVERQPDRQVRDRALPRTMRALLKVSPGPGAEIRRIPVPEPGPDDVLIRVKAASICGTDLHIYTWDPWAAGRVHPPMVFGHEFCGEVVRVGSKVDLRLLGRYVAVESHITCGVCHECTHRLSHVCRDVTIIGVDRPGAFAEYVSVPAANVWSTDRRLPPSIATIQEPMGNAVHTALAQPVAGASVAIFGAGPIGLFAVPIVRASGARLVLTVEPSSFRRDLARRMGSDVVIDPADEDVVGTLLRQTDGEGVDVALEMSGNPRAIAQSFQGLRHGGNAALLGIPSQPVELDLADSVIFKGVTVRGITGRRLWETWYQTRGFLDAGLDLTPIITHQLPLAEFATAFELVRTGRSGKVVLTLEPD